MIKGNMIDLQLFAEGETVDTTEDSIDTKDGESVQSEKTFTQDEVNSIVDKRLSRAMSKAEEEKARLIAEKEQEKELAKLSEKERAEKEFEIERKKFEEEKLNFERERLKLETAKELGKRGLDVGLVDYIVRDNEQSTKDSLENFNSIIQSMLEKMVNERLRGSTPSKSNSDSSKISLSDFKKMGYGERVALKQSDPDLYNKMISE